VLPGSHRRGPGPGPGPGPGERRGPREGEVPTPVLTAEPGDAVLFHRCTLYSTSALDRSSTAMTPGSSSCLGAAGGRGGEGQVGGVGSCWAVGDRSVSVGAEHAACAWGCVHRGLCRAVLCRAVLWAVHAIVGGWCTRAARAWRRASATPPTTACTWRREREARWVAATWHERRVVAAVVGGTEIPSDLPVERAQRAHECECPG
jgi:hypothetical protein